MFHHKDKTGDTIQKALHWENKGDQYFEKQQYEKAMEAYRKSSELNPDHPGIYEKLTRTQDLLGSEWNEEDFSETMFWVMKRQELENPQIKDLHETLSVEYAEVKALILKMLATSSELRNSYIEKIKSYEQKAVLPLLHTLISLTEMAQQVANNSESEEESDEAVSEVTEDEKNPPGESE